MGAGEESFGSPFFGLTDRYQYLQMRETSSGGSATVAAYHPRDRILVVCSGCEQQGAPTIIAQLYETKGLPTPHDAEVKKLVIVHGPDISDVFAGTNGEV